MERVDFSVGEKGMLKICQFRDYLRKRLADPMPPPQQLAKYLPKPNPWSSAALPPHARTAAVLILLYPQDEEWHLPLILRTTDNTVHSGQVSLPGGAVEAEETSAEAAVREYREELGDAGDSIELLGNLSAWPIHASNYLVTPWVGMIQRPPKFHPCVEEVAAVLEVPLLHLFDPGQFGYHKRTHGEMCYEAPHFHWKEYRIWGATCRILGEFLTLAEDFFQENNSP